MNTRTVPQRSGLLVLVALAIGIAAAACGPTSAGDTTAAPTASAAGEGVSSLGAAAPEPSASAPAPIPGPTDLSPTYPDTAEAYAKAVVAAWVQDQPSTLASLTTPTVNAQILDLLPSVNDNWSYLRCDGTAGSSYCSFTNADGDLLTLRITHSLLAHAHAAIQVTLDVTEYPADGVAYVKEFVGAWQFGNTARMLKLSSPSVVAKVKTPPVSPTYPAPTCCGGGLLQVKVQWSGITARFDVGTIKLGGPNAIIDYVPGQLPITL
jgi:hypothetical protein